MLRDDEGDQMGRSCFHIYLSFLTLMTDIMTSRLPNTAAMMINIIIDAEKTAIKILIQS